MVMATTSRSTADLLSHVYAHLARPAPGLSWDERDAKRRAEQQARDRVYQAECKPGAARHPKIPLSSARANSFSPPA